MNTFQRARSEAWKTREKLAPGKSNSTLSAKELLLAVEDQLGIGIEPVASAYPDLGAGSAVLQREQEFIFVSEEIPEWGDVFCGLVAHELGHWYLDPTGATKTVASLKSLFGSDGSPALMKVEAYGARERRELLANVYARELLLPRSVAKALADSGKGPREIAKQLGIPLEFVRQQVLDALLLPNTEMPSSALKPPSKDQLAAARAEERAANVVAGPGTGKTSTLIHRVKFLIDEKKIDPSQILVLTFTNKAAFELVERLRGAGIEQAADIWAGTFHAFGLEFLRKFHQNFQLEADLQVADQLTMATLLAAHLPQLSLVYYLRVEDPYDWLGPVIEGIKRLKEELVSPADYREFVTKHPAQDEELQRRRQDVATLYEAHEALLANARSVDFVDLIGKPAIALKSDRKPFAELADRFLYILVDEYQDVTQAMVEFLRQLAAKHAKSVWVVGDVRQAIHHWRGASLKSLQKFDEEFKAHARSSKIQRYPLDTNRRSSAEILELVKEVGRQHKLEPSMPLDPMTAANGVSGIQPRVIRCGKREDILGAVVAGVRDLEAQGIKFENQAVLCRRGGDVRNVASALASSGVPVIYIGELAQRAEVKKVLCLMQLLVEKRPKALIGLMGMPGVAMPLVDIHLLLDKANSEIRYQRGRWRKHEPEGLSVEAAAAVTKLNQVLADYYFGSSPWSFVCDVLLEHRFGLPDPSDHSVSAWVQRIALWQFAHVARNGDGENKQATLSRFLMRQRLRQRIGNTYNDRELPPEASGLDGVRLLTVHGSKGLEFEAVHVAYANVADYGAQAPKWVRPDDLITIVPPEVLRSSQAEHDFESAVERNNLLYVAVSRAKRHLRIYEENEFGDDNLAPQLQHFPPKYELWSYTAPTAHAPVVRGVPAFAPPKVVKFEHFDTYALCALQYWYSQVLGLKSEKELDVSTKARMAVMNALRKTAAAEGESAELFQASWEEQKLPPVQEDPHLLRDAELAFSRGLSIVRTLAKKGGTFAEPMSLVGGATVQMPWGFLIQGPNSVEFAMMRFARRRVSEILTILKPMVSGLMLPGTKKLTLHHVLSSKTDDVPGGKKLEATKSFRAAVRMLAGDNSATKGRHCGRCAYLTICPSAPKLPRI